MKDRIARVIVTKELLVQSLYLPSDTEIVEIRNSEDGRDLELIVRHKDLPEVTEGNQPPLADPQFDNDYTSVWFVGWGI